MFGGKNFWVGVLGSGVSTGVLRVAWDATWPGFKYSSAISTASLPPIADAKFLINSFSSYNNKVL